MSASLRPPAEGAPSTGSAAVSYPRLLGDVGGTHARFAWVEQAGAGFSRHAGFDCDDHDGLQKVIAHYLSEQHLAAPPAGAIGIATPVTGDRVRMTNRDWSFSIEAVKQAIGFRRFVVVNDFAALALALPTLADDEWTAIGGPPNMPPGPTAADAALAVLGPGTGLGVGGLARTASGFVPIVGEGGHTSLAAVTDDEDRLLSHLRGSFGHVSAERVLSGQGLVNLYRAVCELKGEAPRALDAPAVTAHAIAGDDARCVEAVEQFFAWLGSVAGDVALTIGARGGVYLGGGIVPQLGDWIGRSAFRERFEAKGRFRDYLSAIPTRVIHDASMLALRGADRALDI